MQIIVKVRSGPGQVLLIAFLSVVSCVIHTDGGVQNRMAELNPGESEAQPLSAFPEKDLTKDKTESSHRLARVC